MSAIPRPLERPPEPPLTLQAPLLRGFREPNTISMVRLWVSYWGDDFLLYLCGVGRVLDLDVYANGSAAHILLPVQRVSQ